MLSSSSVSRFNRNGFSLVEVLVVIAILWILAAIALPAYNNYTLKAKFSEVVLSTAPAKSAVAACAATGDCLSGASIAISSSASAPMPCVGSGAGCSPATKYVATVSSDASGVVTATAAASSGLAGETYILIPSYSGGRVDWTVSGTCKTRSGGALC